MNYVFFVLLCLLTGRVAGFGTYGGYERIMFYYAYLIDAGDSATGKAGKWATGCIPARGQKCTFDEFVKYINEANTMPNIHGSTDAPDLDRTAKALSDGGLTGNYKIQRIDRTCTLLSELFEQVNINTYKKAPAWT